MQDLFNLWFQWNIVFPVIAGIVAIGVIILIVLIGRILGFTAVTSGNIFVLLVEMVETGWTKFWQNWFPPQHWSEREKWEAARAARKRK